MKIPILKKDCVSVLRAQWKTGIIVNNDNTRFSKDQAEPEDGGKEYYMIYNSFEEAKSASLSALEKDSIFEYIIYDYSGNYMECYRPPLGVASTLRRAKSKSPDL